MPRTRRGIAKFGPILLAAAGVGALSMRAPAPRQPAGQTTEPAPVRFEAVDIFVDSGEVPLAAYQVEVKAGIEVMVAGRSTFETPGTLRLVGVEGGDAAAFVNPPYYDPKALAVERVVFAAYSMKPDEGLPKGATRVARLHMQVPARGVSVYFGTLVVAGDSLAREITATVRAEKVGEVSPPPPAGGEGPK